MFDKIFGDYVELGVGLIISALIIIAATTSMMLSRQFNEKQLESQIVSNEIKEQRNNLFYDNTDVHQQDVVALILRYRGDKTIIVKDVPDVLVPSTKKTYTWKGNSNPALDWKVSSISNLLPRNKMYRANLLKGPNGYEIVGYEFTMIP